MTPASTLALSGAMHASLNSHLFPGDGLEAAAILASDRYAADVRAAEDFWRRQGVQAVPTLVIDGRYLISGGQTADVFERALRRIAAEKAAAA